MGYRQERAAIAVPLPHVTKHILVTLAFHACEDCGRAWPGVPLLVRETGIGERAVRAALEDLRANPKLVTVYAYPRGGRGVTTEYVVMPEVARLSPAQCGKCSSKSDTLRAVQGKAPSGGENPAREGSKTLHGRGDQPSVNPQPSARARARRGAASPQLPLDSPTPHPAPDADAENARQAAQLVQRISETVQLPDRPGSATDGRRRGS